MSQLNTAYDFSRGSMHQTFFLPLLFAIIGLYVLAYCYGFTTYYIAFLFGRFKTRQQAIFTGYMFTIIGGLIAMLVFTDNYKTFSYYNHIYKKQKYQVVEGQVSDFHRSTDRVHEPEHFNVDSVHFEYGDNSTEGYGYSLADDDVIKPNLFVKISYFYDGNHIVILKLEIQ